MATFSTVGRKGRRAANSPNRGIQMAGLFKRTGGAKNPLLVQSLQQFADILDRKGATDPARLNEDLRTISRAGDIAVDQTQGDLARMGLQRSGVGQAVSAAQRTATAGAIGQRRVLETQLQEERERSDIQDFLNFLDRQLAGEGLQVQFDKLSDDRKAGLYAAIGGLLGSFLGPAGAAFGTAVGGAVGGG